MNTPTVAVQPLQDQVHFLTACDVIVAGSNSFAAIQRRPAVHADRYARRWNAVSAILPAMAGEELVAYATGLGQTNPALTTGQPAAQSSPTVATFNFDFNYRRQRLATKPGAVGAPPSLHCSPAPPKAISASTRSISSSRRLPPELQPCVDFAAIAGLCATQCSPNLTVSVGSTFSFDGAGICVEPSPVLDPRPA